MKPSFMRAARTRNPDSATRWLRALPLLLGSSSLLLQGCHRDAERRLKERSSWKLGRSARDKGDVAVQYRRNLGYGEPISTPHLPLRHSRLRPHPIGLRTCGGACQSPAI
jgi:hypothetical protein